MGKTTDCPYCDRRCSTTFNLNRHVLNVHGVKFNDNGNFACCHCFTNHRHLEDLVAHHETTHGFPAKYEMREFPSMEKFREWKEEMEKTTHSRFSASTGSRTAADGIQKWYLKCHRSGTYIPKGTGARQLKSQGSVKSGGTCLAHMKVSKDGPLVTVKYQSSHLGHDFQLCHTTLSTSEKATIAEKLQEGVTLDAVLDSIRSNLDGSLQRIHLATRQDLHNIMRDFKITYNEKLHENDYVSVALWVAKMKAEHHNPVPFFKQQNEQDDPAVLNRTQGELLDERYFLLVIMTPPQCQLLTALGTDRICIDGTHGTTGFDFELVTLLCVDEFGCVREQTGNLHVKAFMSDDAPAFYNAWKDTMGSAERQLLCTWHIDKNWRENIRKHLKDKQAQEFTYKAGGVCIGSAVASVLSEIERNVVSFWQF
ncbi:uncharacterized protein LOC135377038 [Ornithodoros turicata]|uniref:uncharacterized protein LOC135377038 n=1 Tax=Ornithodoros turicata TaxID=34597 RepID=UPI003138CDCD